VPVALITGAAVGFGRGLARVFGRAGFSLSLVDVRAELEATADEIRRTGTEVLSVSGDVTDDSVLRSVVERTIDTFGHIDLLINNAGQVRFSPIDLPIETAIAHLDELWRVNTRAPYVLGRLVIPHMIAAGSGHIINIATDHIHTCGFPEALSHEGSEDCAWSDAPRRPLGPGPFDAYDASKWALNGFTQNWAHELRKHGIRVNNICLGATDSEMMREAVLVGRGRPATAREIESWMPTEQVADVVRQLHDEGPDGRSGDNVGIWLGHPIELPSAHAVMGRRV
jgi:NAD(P)-dependent dehydrogenase (short-subunit alcohol dehydrogenase family)